MTTIDTEEINLHMSMYDPVARKKSFKKWPFKSRSSCSVPKVRNQPCLSYLVHFDALSYLIQYFSR